MLTCMAKVFPVVCFVLMGRNSFGGCGMDLLSSGALMRENSGVEWRQRGLFFLSSTKQQLFLFLEKSNHSKLRFSVRITETAS